VQGSTGFWSVHLTLGVLECANLICQADTV